MSREKYLGIGRKLKNLPIIISSSSSSLANSFSLRTLLTNSKTHGIAVARVVDPDSLNPTDLDPAFYVNPDLDC